MSDQYWTTRLGQPDETDAVFQLVRTVHGNRYPELNRSYWQWRYLSNEQFRADIVMAEHKGRVIGIQPVTLFDFRWDDARLKGAMYTGVLTHPAHRRRGVFHSLVTSANEHAARRGAHFSITMPNNASLPGFRRFGGWAYPGLIPLYVKVANRSATPRPGAGRAAAELLGSIDRLCQVGRLCRVDRLCRVPRAMFRRPAAGRPQASLDVETVDQIPEELDEVAEPFARECAALNIPRSAAYWNWRYCNKPASAYRTLLARRGGQVVGAVVMSVGRRLRMEVGMILDLVASGGLVTIRELLHVAEQDFAARGVCLITCQATSPLLQQALSDEGYLRPPARLLPKRFHFVYHRTGAAGMSRNPNALSDWHLTFGDSDNA